MHLNEVTRVYGNKYPDFTGEFDMIHGKKAFINPKSSCVCDEQVRLSSPAIVGENLPSLVSGTYSTSSGPMSVDTPKTFADNADKQRLHSEYRCMSMALKAMIDDADTWHTHSQ